MCFGIYLIYINMSSSHTIEESSRVRQEKKRNTIVHEVSKKKFWGEEEGVEIQLLIDYTYLFFRYFDVLIKNSISLPFKKNAKNKNKNKNDK